MNRRTIIWLRLLAMLALLCTPAVACIAMPGVQGTPGRQVADWVASRKHVCIEVEQSYSGLPGHAEPIAETMQDILGRTGVEATVGTAAGCDATLSLKLEVTPVAKDYAGSIEDCYTGAVADGEAALSAPGQRTLTVPLKYTVQGSQVITECPTRPEEAPIEAAWAQAMMPMLREWWGSPALVSALKSGSSLMRWAAIHQLSQMGPEASGALPVLVEMLGDADPRARAAAAEALGAFGPAAAGAIAPLGEAIDDAEPGVRYAAITALGDIKDSQAVPVLVKALHHTDSYARYLAAQALGKLGQASAPAVPDLIAAVDDEFSQAGRAAVDALGAIGPDAREAVPRLIQLLEGEDWSYHSGAASALKNIAGQDFGKDAVAWRKWWEAQP